MPTVQSESAASLKAFLESQGYLAVRQLPDGPWIGLKAMMFTTGLFVGLDAQGYHHRYCYDRPEEAMRDCRAWDGSGDPPGNWIKRKGVGGDRSNPNYVKAPPDPEA